ncbi:T9SS type A sorting domain-containing protein [Halpernia sp. GG3]
MMNKFICGVFFIICSGAFAQNNETATKRKLLQKQYLKLEKSLKKEHVKLEAAGIPPNAYNEQDFKNTLDPTTGMPAFSSLIKLRKDLNAGKFAPKTALSFLGGTTSNVNGKTIINQTWTERGPYAVGGRTRAMGFDPNDPTGKRVFAGGVSGGLWVNQDISNSASEWKPLSQFWANTSVVSIAFDPNNPLVFYVGTGETETNDNSGSGIWKTTDGGTTFTNIFTVPVTYLGTTRRGNFYINDIKVRNNAGVSEIYAGVSGGYNAGSFNGLYEAGLYKSTDGGATFTRNTSFEAYSNGGTNIGHSIQQIEIAADNSVWISTRISRFGNVVPSGGKIFRSTDGVTFTNIYNSSLLNSRVNFSLSKTNPLKAYVLMQGADASTEPVRILKTINGGSTWQSTNDSTPSITLPVDADIPQPAIGYGGIPANDFTRGQSFYDLIILADPTDDNIVYTGGIDLFKSTDGAANWSQISKWSNNYGLAALPISTVHADQHSLVFNIQNQNQMLSGNDGGIYFVSDKANIATATGFNSRNNRYNVTQYYRATLNPTKTSGSEEFIAGAQDNGTQKFAGVPQTNNFYNTSNYTGGDGAFTEYDDNAQYIISSYVYNTHYLQSIPAGTSNVNLIISADRGLGHFINEMTVDRNLDIFYSYRAGLSINKVTGLLSSGPQTLVQTTISAETPAATEQVSALKVSPFTTASSTLFVGSNLGKLYKIINADTSTPTSTVFVTNFVGTISDIEFGISESQILVTISNYGATTVNVFYSDDAGVSWKNKEGNLPDMPVRSILMNPLQISEVIIGTELGVWGTANFMDPSPTWAQYAGDMGNVRVTDLDYRPSTFTVLASTYGRGAWTNTIGDALSTSNVISNSSVKIYPNPSNGILHVKYDNVKYKNLTVTIFDASGKLVFTKINVSSDQEFQTNLIKGFYVLKAMSGTEKVLSSSLLIN